MGYNKHLVFVEALNDIVQTMITTGRCFTNEVNVNDIDKALNAAMEKSPEIMSGDLSYQVYDELFA